MTNPNTLKDLLEVTEDKENGLIFEKNVSIPRTGTYPIRCNVYRPISSSIDKFPVLVTYGPYGKDIPYEKSVLQFPEQGPN
jgi:hypothetical protein